MERAMHSIFKRCVSCPPQTPTCPDCPSNQICSLVPASCDACQHMVCIANPSPPPESGSTNVGAIAGGVIGGLAFVALLTFCIWKFCIKSRAEPREIGDGWQDGEVAQHKDSRQFEAMRSDAASTRTRGSIANTILSRASNIIHIAYFPSVMNRSGSNSVLVNTPVPPIPAQYAPSPARSPLSNEGDALFFRPGSTYSDASSMRSGRNRDTQYTVQSITPSLARSSMMSEVYRDDATTEPMPATQIMRVAPRMVSVRHSPAASPSASPRLTAPTQSATSSPPLPTNYRGSGGQFTKATQVTVGGKGKGKGRFPIVQQSPSTGLSPSEASKRGTAASSPLVETSTESDEEEDEHARARRSLVQAASRAADPAPLIQPVGSPFFDDSDLRTAPTPITALTAGTTSSSPSPPAPNPYAAMSASVRAMGNTPRRADDRGPGGLSAVIEEASRRPSRSPIGQNPNTTGSTFTAPRRDESPFSDVDAATPLNRGN